MAGTIPLSMTQQFNEFGEPLAGGQLFLYQAGTVATPQNPFQDAGLSIVMPNPIVLDAAGRIPQFFLADGFIKVRLTDAAGITQLAADGILVIGPSAGGGGGGSVDPTTVLATGDVKPRYDTSVITGWVRCNGRTIGPAGSIATELADNSAQALFNHLWNKDPNLVVTPSRGASSAADWAANRVIALPDFRGCAITGLDDMGNTAAGRLTATYFGANATVLGNLGGAESRTLTAAQIPGHQHSVFLRDPQHAHSIATNNPVSVSTQIAGSGLASIGTGTTAAASTNITIGSVNGVANDNLTAANAGGGGAHAALGPRRLLTIYIKL